MREIQPQWSDGANSAMATKAQLDMPAAILSARQRGRTHTNCLARKKAITSRQQGAIKTSIDDRTSPSRGK